MGRKTVSCGDCVHLIYIDGVIRCAELDFLIWPELVTEGLDCNRFQHIKDLKNFKTFTGYATSNNREVVEELVLEALMQLCVINGRLVSASELSEFMGHANPNKILNRLIVNKRVFMERKLTHHPNAPRRKYWVQFFYGAELLKGKGVFDEAADNAPIDITRR